MKPKPFPFAMPGQREEPMAPPAWWRRLLRWRKEARKLRDSRVWGMWERLSPVAKQRYRKRHGGKPPVRVAPVYPRVPVCRPKRHRRSGRGRLRMACYRRRPRLLTLRMRNGITISFSGVRDGGKKGRLRGLTSAAGLA